MRILGTKIDTKISSADIWEGVQIFHQKLGPFTKKILQKNDKKL